MSILQQIADRASDNVTAAKNHSLLSGGVDAALRQKLHHSFRSAGDKERATAPLSQLTDVDRTESIDILLIGDSRGDGMFGQVLGERQLDENAMDRGVIVGLGDLLEDLGLCDVLGEVDNLADDTGLIGACQ